MGGALMTAVLLVASLIIELVLPWTNLGSKRLLENIGAPEPKSIDSPVINPLPIKTGAQPRSFFAFSGMILDANSNTVIMEKDPDSRRPIASITKLMTAIVIADSHKLDEVVTVPEFSIDKTSTKMGLKAGDKVRVEELLHGLLIPSGADAAVALAVFHSGQVDKFAEEMNKKAALFGLKNTNFKNPTGNDIDGAYSSARDVVNLGRIVLSNPKLKEIIAKKSYVAKAEDGKAYIMSTTNLVLDNVTIFGIKTGFTDGAGQCLLALGRKNGHEIISVVLNSPDRFGESRGHINWVIRNFSW